MIGSIILLIWLYFVSCYVSFVVGCDNLISYIMHRCGWYPTIKIIQFNNETYAVRRITIWGYEYLEKNWTDAKEPNWWTRSCIGELYMVNSYEAAQKLLNRFKDIKRRAKDYGKVVKPFDKHEV